jgi:hypothetical protein
MKAAGTSSRGERVVRASLLAVLVSAVPAAALAGATGYVWASRPTAAEYTPAPHESFSSAHGVVTVRRLGAGRYEVRFDGLSLPGGTVQVSAGGASAARCNVSGWTGPRLLAGVTCVDPRGQPLDAPFSLLALSGPAGAGPLAYAWADKPAAAEYEPRGAYAFNSAGGPIRVRRVGPGRYDVTFTGLHMGAGNVQVTGYGASDSYCKVVGWGGTGLSVACFDLSGRPADARFTALFLGRGSVGGLSYLWGSRPAVVSYAPPAGFTHNAVPGASRIERLGVGRYALLLPGPREAGGTALVTAYGAAATACVLAGITRHAGGHRVTVSCFRPDGGAADSAYSAAYVRLAARPPASSPAGVAFDATGHAALLAGRPYAWPGAAHQIEAVLEAPSRRQGELGLDSMTWRCQEVRCTAQTFLQPTVDLCRSLAREVGKVRRFTTPARALPAADVERCNSALDAVQTVAGRMALARTQVFYAAPARTLPSDPALAAKPGPLPMPFPIYEELLDSLPEIQDDLRQAAGWDYMVYPDGKDQHKFYFLPREYRLALEDGAGKGLALSFNYLHEGSDGADVLMTARLRAPQVPGDLRLLKALAGKTLIGRAGRIELVPFPVDEAQVEIADVLTDFGVSATNVRAEAPDDVLDPIRLTMRMSEEAQQNLLSQLRTRHGLAGHVRLKAGDVVANVPLTLSLAEFAGTAVKAAQVAGATSLENRSGFPVTVKGWVGYAESASGLRRVSLPLPRPLALEPRARGDAVSAPPGADGPRLVHAWLDYDLDTGCGPCLDAIESGATTQAGLTRRADLVVEALPSVFSELSLEKLLLEVESAYFNPAASPEVRAFTLYPDEHRATARLFVDANRGADAEKARYRFRSFAAGGAGEFSPWQSTSSLDITLTPHDVRSEAAALGGQERN